MEVSVCSLIYTLPAFGLYVNKKATKSFKNSDKFMMGCKAAAGIPVSEIAQEFQASREWVYQQKERVQNHIDSIDNGPGPVPSISLDGRFEKRMILSLSLDCHASAEGIQRTFSSVFGMHVSIGKISSVLEEASERAQLFDSQVPLGSITQGANDEIFQGDTPVLTGIDPESTYTYLLAEAGDRSADTWELYMEDCKDRGLDLKVSISDAGTGLTAGIPRAFPDTCIQPDVFHELRPIGAEVSRLERKACKLIEKEAGLERRACGKRPQKKTREQLAGIRPEVRDAVQGYDTLAILFGWLVELTGFSGYPFQEACALAGWVLSEMEAAFPEREKLLAHTAKFRGKLPQVLSFLGRLQAGFGRAAGEKGIPPEAFGILYREKALPASSPEYSQLEYKLGALLGDGYETAKEEFCRVVENTKRASSLVENLNSRIRVYMNLKRTVPEKYFVLLKVYFNTKKYRRSRIPERVGKSPLELMTGQEYPEFLDVLGY